LQRIALQAAAPILRGAVVIMEVSSGEILAMVSRPDFDQTHVAAFLDDPDSPLFNRATAAYNVGSCFKLAVAAAALQNGFFPAYSYVCPGYYQLGEQRYACHQLAGHWQLSMTGAMEQSCNPYFINLGQQLGAKKLLDMAEALGFGTPTVLCDGVVSAAGSLPADPGDVSSGELANLSFGQGTLTATPVQLAQMTAIIAGGGGFVTPTLYKGVTHDGRCLPVPEAVNPRQVLSPRTAATLRGMMIGVVERGSGKRARPMLGGGGGKTSSAQTGTVKNGAEVVHGWFSGFYPAEQPRYTITVLEEGGGSGAARPAAVFAKICNEICLRENYNLCRSVK
ncbi:MAG: penicillin-binding transpeptidase domain-containing protein, partial [Angelakisella sp.]